MIEFTDIFRLIQDLLRKTIQRSGRRLLVYIYKRKSGFRINQRAAQTTEPKIMKLGVKILLMTQSAAKKGFSKIPPLRGVKNRTTFKKFLKNLIL